jgi:alpha-galactosidase
MTFAIAFIGAGSIGFTRGLLADLLTVPEFRDLSVTFMDLNPDNLRMCTELCQRDLDANGLPIRIRATTDRREAVRGARYVFCTFRVGGLEAFRHDIDIPLSYGVDQCVGDTLCAGGVMYGQRGIAAMLELCRDIRAAAEPGCLLLNYANPMAMLTWAANTAGGVRCLGLCHGVQGGHHQIASCVQHWARQEGLIGADETVSKREVTIAAVGINHQTWYVQAQWRGHDLVPRMLELFEGHPEFPRTEKVRIDVLRRFGYYSTESNGHLSEYLPWYRRTPEAVRRWSDLGCWINGETGGYLRVCSEGRTWFEHEFPRWMAEPPRSFAADRRGEEHGSYIIEALETGRPYRGHFNVVNQGAVPNLPADAVVEVPAWVDRSGIAVPRCAELPPGCAAVCSQSIGVQRLAVQAAVAGDDRLLREAALLDPLVGAVCEPPAVWQLVDEMLVAQRAWLPQYGAAIAAAEARLAQGKAIPTTAYAGAARLAVKDIEAMRRDRAAADANAGEADKAKVRVAAG